MASDIIDGVSEQLDQLRQALKEWERAYAAANGGRKASREDIKKDPTIGKYLSQSRNRGRLDHADTPVFAALKYKDYNRLRPLHTNTVSQKPAALPASQLSPSKKRKHRPVPSTPVKRPRSSQQMSPVRTSFTGEKDPYESPATVRSLFRTPTIKRTSFGPTPQKDGKVLGLFDNLSPGSAKKAESQVQLKSDFVPVQVSTPQKNLQAEASQGDLPISSNNQLSLPAATPSRRRGISNGITTPQSSSVLQFLTPEFLRRDSRQIRLGPSAIDQREHFHAGDRAIAGDIGDSPVIIRMPAKAPIKGLSAILADLRKADQERFDDDEEALRETEGKPTKQPTTLVEDSQMPLGADGEIFEDDSEDDDAVTQNRGRDGEPLKIWKKKGQKRTTRRVISEYHLPLLILASNTDTSSATCPPQSKISRAYH
jgi:DNA replication regulator SLD2